ncbi:putative conserved membrane protein [Synechococcus sp. A18-40]|nr:putative conserved membrane protein [Synechococcus sp. A18-40]
MTLFAAIASPINDIADSLGANDLPYAIPLHPNLVHLTIGLFAIGIAFDFAGAFYCLEKRVFRFLALPVTRSGFHDVGWYNLVACSGITFFTVAAGFYEISRTPTSSPAAPVWDLVST